MVDEKEVESTYWKAFKHIKRTTVFPGASSKARQTPPNKRFKRTRTSGGFSACEGLWLRCTSVVIRAACPCGLTWTLGLNNWDPKATFVDIKLEGAMPVRPINGYGMSICCFTSFPAPTQQGLGYE
jgi:hypothetical protein